MKRILLLLPLLLLGGCGTRLVESPQPCKNGYVLVHTILGGDKCIVDPELVTDICKMFRLTVNDDSKYIGPMRCDVPEIIIPLKSPQNKGCYTFGNGITLGYWDNCITDTDLSLQEAVQLLINQQKFKYVPAESKTSNKPAFLTK